MSVPARIMPTALPTPTNNRQKPWWLSPYRLNHRGFPLPGLIRRHPHCAVRGVRHHGLKLPGAVQHFQLP